LPETGQKHQRSQDFPGSSLTGAKILVITSVRKCLALDAPLFKAQQTLSLAMYEMTPLSQQLRLAARGTILSSFAMHNYFEG